MDIPKLEFSSDSVEGTFSMIARFSSKGRSSQVLDNISQALNPVF